MLLLPLTVALIIFDTDSDDNDDNDDDDNDDGGDSDDDDEGAECDDNEDNGNKRDGSKEATIVLRTTMTMTMAMAMISRIMTATIMSPATTVVLADSP